MTQRAEHAERRWQAQDDQVVALRGRLARLSRRIAEEQRDFNFDYVHFQNQFRGTREEIRRRQTIYLDDFRGAGSVVDLGCGRGEFVELLREAGIAVTGVDRDAAMIDFCHELGLPVVEEDIFAYLHAVPDRQINGIFCSQVVEHLNPQGVLELLEACRAKLAEGGVLVVETVNPLCVGALCNFWIDPTHERPVHPRLLHHLLRTLGFRELEVVFSSPTAESSPPILRTRSWSDADTLNHQDYAIVARS